MPISEARHKANEKYNAKAYEEIKVRVKKGKKELIQQKANECGESVNAFINRHADWGRKIDVRFTQIITAVFEGKFGFNFWQCVFILPMG